MTSPPLLNMSVLPPIFVVPTHLDSEDLHELEDALYQAAARVTYRATEARVFLTKVVSKKRVALDLRARGLWTQEEQLPGTKSLEKRRLSPQSGSSTETESENEEVKIKVDIGLKRKRSPTPPSNSIPDLSSHIVVLKPVWLETCNKSNEILPFEPYLVYSAKIIEKPPKEKSPIPTGTPIKYIKAVPESESRIPLTKPTSIMERAQIEAASMPAQPFHRRKFGQKPTSSTLTHTSRMPKFHTATTSEMEAADPENLPPLPPWMTEKHPRPTYSCLRSTPPIEQSPNCHFIMQLNKIKEARLLTLDEIGVRAYSTSIASLLAYPYRITSPAEVLRLPGCNERLASLWIDWHESVTLSSLSEPPSPSPANTINTNDQDSHLDSQRTLPAVSTLQSDTDLTHLRQFHDIWGVGPETARRFYFDNQWRDIDDVVEFGWTTLTRVQQIGLKFYDEFKQTIPRAEVEFIARTILHHARLAKSIPKTYWTNDVISGQNGADASCLGDPRDFVAVLVGGYRRGKAESGDVDVILSHRDDTMTSDLIIEVVKSLESAGYITHTLTLHTTNSDRGQQTLPFNSAHSGHGFDSLDKALCVWQDPEFPSSLEKNPNIHRRVDIIVSPWRTVGCAVLGWSGGTTFQRDLRRWVKKIHGWKFDSSGVRDRGNGRVLDLESVVEGGGDGWEDRERRVMEKMGIGWRMASERCTG